jgi:hypothetical protein
MTEICVDNASTRPCNSAFSLLVATRSRSATSARSRCRWASLPTSVNWAHNASTRPCNSAFPLLSQPYAFAPQHARAADGPHYPLGQLGHNASTLPCNSAFSLLSQQIASATSARLAADGPHYHRQWANYAPPAHAMPRLTSCRNQIAFGHLSTLSLPWASSPPRSWADKAVTRPVTQRFSSCRPDRVRPPQHGFKHRLSFSLSSTYLKRWIPL